MTLGGTWRRHPFRAACRQGCGRTILVASLMGWQIAGVQGLVASTLGMLLPAASLAWMVGG